MKLLDQVPKASFGLVGGSGTLSSDFPARTKDADVMILADELHFATPYGASPAMRLFAVGEKRVLTWYSPETASRMLLTARRQANICRV